MYVTYSLTTFYRKFLVKLTKFSKLNKQSRHNNKKNFVLLLRKFLQNVNLYKSHKNERKPFLTITIIMKHEIYYFQINLIA